MSEIIPVQFAVSGERFRKTQSDCIARISLYFHTNPSGDVLS